MAGNGNDIEQRLRGAAAHLLPKLVSGEIDVSEAEDTLKKAAQ